jgi:hypothetical protein
VSAVLLPAAMAPVPSPAADSAVDPTGQLVATYGTYALALVALVAVVRLCLRERVVWPALVLAGGTLTCLLEPLFDHLYGLWFPTVGQWTLFVTYGVHEPVWLPAAYLVVYGALPVAVVRLLRRDPGRRTVWRVYAALVVVAVVAEIGYIRVLGVYGYQDRQPFVVLGYPLFLGFVNSMSALIGGLVLVRLVPLLRGAGLAALLTVPPMAFAVDAIGSGFLYLAVRNSADPPRWALDLTALTVVAGGVLTVRLLALLLPDAPSAVSQDTRARAVAAGGYIDSGEN